MGSYLIKKEMFLYYRAHKKTKNMFIKLSLIMCTYVMVCMVSKKIGKGDNAIQRVSW